MPSKPTVEVRYDFAEYQWGHRFHFRGRLHQIPRYDLTLTIKDGTITGDYNVITEAGGWDEIIQGAKRVLANEMEVSEYDDDDFDELEVVINEVYLDIQNCDLVDADVSWSIADGEVYVYAIQLKAPLYMKNTSFMTTPHREFGFPRALDNDGSGLYRWPFPGCSMDGQPLFAHERYFNILDQHGLIVTKELGY